MRALLIAATAVLAGGTAHADELQDRLVAGARASDTSGYAFRQTIGFSGTGQDAKTLVTAYDPRQTPDNRWQLVSIDGKAPTAEQAAKSRKQKRDKVPSYADLAKWLGATATRVDGAGGLVTYRYSRLPDGTVKLGSHDASADIAADVLVDTRGAAPFVEQVRYRLTRGFRMMLVASVKSMAVDSRFQRLSDGRLVPGTTVSVIAGSMMGKSGEIRTTISYADWRKVR